MKYFKYTLFIMDEKEFNEKYNVKTLKVSYEKFNEAYQIFFGVENKQTEEIEKIFSTYIHIKNIEQDDTSESLINKAYLSLKETILNSLSNETLFGAMIDKVINN